MKLGAFSVSLNVKDIKKSKAFYEKLGFKEFHGNIDENWIVMKNGDVKIGLFQDMFQKNIITFNPGWNQDSEEVDSFTDVREIESKLEEAGVEIKTKTEGDKGPAHIELIDPDGNPILIDQHV